MADANVGNIVAHLRVDAAEWQRGLQQATAQLTQFQQSVGWVTPAAQQVQQSLNGIGQATNQLTQQMRAATQATSAWGQALQTASAIGLAVTLDRIVQALGRFVRDSVLLAARMQDLHRSFVAIEGSAQAANRTMATLFDVAQRVGVSFTGLTESFRRLEAGAKGTTLTSEDLKRAMEGIALGARVMGLGTQENARAMQAWEQVLTKGRLTSEELVQQLGEAVPGALNIVSRSLGVTTAQLRAMAEAGLIPGTVAFVAFSEEMRKVGQSTGAITSLSATFERLKNETTAWMTVIGESITNKLQPFLDKIIEISEALRALLGIRGPGQAASGAGPATAEGPYSARTQFPIAPSPYTALIQQEARRSAIDPGLLSQLVRAESGFNPAAVSSAGALGLGQVMLPTAQGLEMGVTRETLLEPERNLRLAAKYLSDMLERFRGFNDQVKLALAAYNAGPGTVENVLNAARRAGTPTTFEAIAPQLPRETQQYVGRVLSPETLQVTGGAQAVQQQAAASNQIVTTWQKNIEDTLQQFGVLQKQVEALNQSGANFGGIMNRDVAQAAERVVQKLVEINQAFATLPALSKDLPASLREQVVEATKQAAVWKEVLLTDQQRAALLERQVDAIEQVIVRQRAQLIEQREGQAAAERFSRTEMARIDAAKIDERVTRAGMTLTQQITQDRTRLQALQQEANQLGVAREAEQALTEDRKRRREERGELDIFGLMLAPEQEAALKQQAKEQSERIKEFAKSLDIFGLEVPPEVERQRRAEGTFDLRLRQQLEQMQLSRIERPEARLRAEMEREGVPLTPERDARLKQMTALREQQEHLNLAVEAWRDLSMGVGSAWVNALSSIAAGTATVADAFRAMGQSIMKTMADIAAQQAFQAVFKLGVGLLTSALMPTVTPAAAGASAQQAAAGTNVFSGRCLLCRLRRLPAWGDYQSSDDDTGWRVGCPQSRNNPE